MGRQGDHAAIASPTFPADEGAVPTARAAARGGVAWESGTSASVDPATLKRHAYFHTSNQAVPTDTATPLRWAADDAVSDIFDFTDGTAPLALFDMVVAVTLLVTANASPGNAAYVSLELDEQGEDAFVDGIFLLDDPDVPTGASKLPRLALSLTYFVPEGSDIKANLTHNVGVDLTCSPTFAVQVLAGAPA